MTKVLVRYFASARAASGVEQETLQLPVGASVSEALGVLRERPPEKLPRVLEAASFLLDGIAMFLPTVILLTLFWVKRKDWF